MVEFGKTIIFVGLALVLAGFLVLMLGKFSHLGRLPGDIFVKKGSFSFYFPLTTCFILSLIFSLVMFFLSKK
ncbi:MAG: DUF2905 domain-containing protein [Candidatus Omnitrophica bacterium]|nr:DUF2905 domain-containing protein [Candidatus Omnitrophota bacterium]